MNPIEESRFKAAVWPVAILLAFLLVFVFLSWMRGLVQPVPLAEERGGERRQQLLELRAQAERELNEYAWQDEARAIVRVPIRRAMELTVGEWEDPEAGKAELLLRHQQATIPADQLYE